ncbi:cytochrome-c peroxidase [Alteromonas lipolytica]|uniref:Cytochrome-c peroxidase n=1 Tax=Alteromonas lipolytica TaxID=1856405 RepID=A0A1E8FBY3_9ALTE|nr:cytochrome c peroxidase [Alteromonas lipolytica]OFI33419.1 cytochrome-c peroxidase [Alteromonas lipolytica]GGF59870.1 cytochrome-c peroxidase [Alteromonas lipolytica]
MDFKKLVLAVVLGSVATTALAVDKNAVRSQAKMMHGPLPAAMPGAENDTPALIDLGERLYFETALSADGTQSCNSCHRIDGGRGGVDNEATSLGVKGSRGDRNSPSVWNAGFHVAQFWDGRAADLAAQAKGPILNPVEMAIPDEQTAISNLKKEGYEALFAEVFKGEADPLTYDNLAKAIGAFERTLITVDRFDKFLAGDDTAITDLEAKGYQTFVQSGCASCHNGATFGGSMYMKMGLVNAYENTHDMGRFAVTNNPADKFVFKVPSLRNITKTAPYFHDGAVAELDQAVSKMAWMQLGRQLSEQELAEIVAFLGALEDTHTITVKYLNSDAGVGH